MRLSLKLLFVFLMSLLYGYVSAETIALSDDPNFIQASILTSSQSFKPQSISGHIALRLQCQTHNLDEVFTFENNGEEFVSLVLDGAQGSMFEVEFSKYFNDLKKDDRDIKEFQLNLTLNEKARLWEVMDSLKTLPDRPFTKDSHCFSNLAEAVDIAVSPNKINWDSTDIYWNSYGENGKLFTQGLSPWNYILIMLPLGNLADVHGEGREYVYPAGFELSYKDFYIANRDGSSRPLIKGEPTVLLKKAYVEKPVHPTPIETAITILAVIALVCIFQLMGKGRIVGIILDIVLWVLVTIGGIFVAVLTWAPGHFGASWNWPLLVLNPVAWVPVVILRRNREAMKWVWGCYAAILVIFAAFMSHVSPSIDPAWRLLAIALAIRCFTKLQLLHR